MSVDINSDYIKISEELFEVKILLEGTCDIHTNVNDMIIFDWSKLTLSIIQKYPHIYYKLMDNVNQQPNYILDKIHNKCILSNIQLFLPENYDFIKKEIASIWINKYKSQLQPMYDEDKFDLNWYEFNSSDYKWAYTRIKKISKIIQAIDNYLLYNYLFKII